MSKQLDDWKTHAHDAAEIKQAEAIAGLLWDYLKRDPEHKDRRHTSGGTKTKLGLLRSIRYALQPGYAPMVVDEMPRTCPQCGLELTQLEAWLSYCPDCKSDVILR